MTTRILSKLIDETILKTDQENRDYIGASSIGESCERAIWYRYNKMPCEPISIKQQRTFNIGKRLESLVLDCLEEAGIKLTRTWCDLNDLEIDNFKGHIDAMWLEEDNHPKAIIEIKTARASSFNLFVNKGLKYWSSSYYAQIQAYMGMSNIHEAYILVLNKDTSELHDEKVLFDKQYYNSLKFKVKRIVEAKQPPAKINESPLFFSCRLCSFKSICH